MLCKNVQQGWREEKVPMGLFTMGGGANRPPDRDISAARTAGAPEQTEPRSQRSGFCLFG